MITVRLEPLHIEYADKVARWRQDAAERLNRQPHNGAPVGHDIELAMNVTGTRCEVAGKLYLNPVKWNAYRERIHGLADLEDWVDVKGAPRSTDRLIVQCDDPAHWAYLLIRAHMHPVYEIVGWCWGKEAQAVPTKDPVGGRAAHFISANASIMKPPEELFTEVRRRQAATKAG